MTHTKTSQIHLNNTAVERRFYRISTTHSNGCFYSNFR